MIPCSLLDSMCKLTCTNDSWCRGYFLISGTAEEVSAKMKLGEVKCPSCGGADNRIAESYAAPFIGGPATIRHYSDRDAATVIAISPSGKTITIQKDKQKLLNAPNSNEPDRLIT